MKQRSKKLLGILLSLALVLSLLPAMALAVVQPNHWTGETYTVTTDDTINGTVYVLSDATLTINSGVTLTVNGSIHIEQGVTLTVKGGGALAVIGGSWDMAIDGSYNSVLIVDGATVSATGGTVGGAGINYCAVTVKSGALTAYGPQGTGIYGDVIVEGGTVSAIGGKYGSSGYEGIDGDLTVTEGEVNAKGGDGSNGAKGIRGSVTISGGAVTATGGSGTTNGGNGIDSGLSGTVTITGGTVTATGGIGSTAEKDGVGISGTLTLGTGIKLETCDDGSSWTDTTSTPNVRTMYMRTSYNASATTYTVRYDANDGTGTMTDGNSPYNEGATVTVLANTFTAPEGKKFDKWNTKADGTGTSYKPDDTYTITAETTFYAQWIDAGGESTDVITKTFDLNTGSEEHQDVEIDLSGLSVYSVSADAEADPIVTADDYTVGNDTLTFKKDYLSKLAVGDHEFTVSGYVVGTDTEAELAVTIKVVDTTPSATPDYYYTETVYKVILAETENGKATASRSTAPKGATVTVTATPDEGYVLDAITAKDAKGSDVTVTDGKFTMPASDVTVTVTFKEDESKPGFATCDHGDGCILNDFSDLDPDAWYHDGVHYVLETGLMEGYGDGTFRPNDFASRAMAITLIWNMEGKPVVNFALPYSDVAQGKWYTEAIRWATSEGIVEGWTDEATGKKVFAPDADVTREQFAVMLYRYAQLHGEGFTGMWMFRLDFPDAADVSDWADEAMHWMVMQGVIDGMDGKLNPQGKATRAMLATMVQRFVLGA